MKNFAGAVVPEPILTWLETADDRVVGRSSVVGGMLAGRVAAADVAALGTPGRWSHQPPTSRHSTQRVPLGATLRSMDESLIGVNDKSHL